MIQFSGVCNRCGQCCTHESEGRLLVCENLMAVIAGGHIKPLGTPEASLCKVYERRVDGMPIRLLDGTGTPRMQGVCAKGSPLEAERILIRGLGRGCSLTVDPTTVPPALEVLPDGSEIRREALFIRTGG